MPGVTDGSPTPADRRRQPLRSSLGAAQLARAVLVGKGTRLTIRNWRISARPVLGRSDPEAACCALPATLTKEQQTGQMFYTAAIHFSAAEMAKLKGLRLIPGMPAEAYIITGERTLANYLIKPLADQMQRGLRER